MAREKHKRRKPRGESTEAEHWGGPIRSSDEGPVNGAGAKGSGQVVVWSKQLETGRCRYIRHTSRSKLQRSKCTRLTKRSNPMRARPVWMGRRSSSSIPTCGTISTNFGTGRVREL